MNQSRFIVLICSLFFIPNNNVYGYLGINWGRTATQRILPSMVVDLLLQNGIREVKIFSPSVNLLPAFVGTDIGVTVSIPNDDLKTINNVDDAKQWIRVKLSRYIKQGLILRNIAVGTQPFSKQNYDKIYYHAVEVLDFMQTAIDELHIGNGTVKATIDLFLDVFNKANKPSEASFSEEVRDVIVRSTKILVKNNASLWIGMFPLYSAKTLFKNDTEFAFFDNNSTSRFTDVGGYAYNNIFEVVHDMFVCALEKEGFRDVKIGVGQVGWPTDGIIDGNSKNAERFNKGLIKHIMSGKGTPRRPAGQIDAFLHNLADENKLKIISGGERRGWVRHWGVYRFDGKPKYHIDFSGQGRDILPYSAKGVTHMPNRWCIFNKQTNDTALLSRLLLDACQNADCTSMEKGGSCGFLSFPDLVSYAFNVFFQEKSQKFSESGCDFEGLGVITSTNPSMGTCVFPIEILSAEFVGNSPSSNTPIFAPAMTGFYMFLYIFFTWQL